MDAQREIDEALQLLRRLGRPTRLTRPSAGTSAPLTRRENEVLALVALGLTNPEIAERLYLSRRTVEHHIGHILAKLALRSRSALVVYSLQSAARVEGAKMGAPTDVLPPPPGRHSP